ncbi:MAG: class II glutamine amidotransferase [Turicibacter sp.]
MCGIFSIIPRTKLGFFHYDFQDVIPNFLVSTSVRGAQSAGIALVKTDQTVDVLKKVGDPYYLLYSKDYYETLIKEGVAKGKAIIGHTRYATKGEITEENAHPFQEKHITLVHNGTINFGLPFEHTKATEVDSHALTKTIADCESDPVKVVEALSKITGAYAIIYYDSNTDELCWAKNNDRPLAYAFNDTHIYLASELKMLEWILDRNKKTVTESNLCESHKLFRYSYKENKTAVIQIPAKPIYTKTVYTYPEKKEEPLKAVGFRNVNQYKTQTIEFIISRVEEIKAGSRKTFQYVGELCDEPMEVIFLSEKYFPWIQQEVLQGVVSQVHKEKNGKHYLSVASRNVFVLLDAGGSIKLDVYDPDTKNFLTLKDGTKLTSLQFLEKASKRCFYCQSKIGIDEADQCTRSPHGDGLICPLCVDTMTDSSLMITHQTLQ